MRRLRLALCLLLCACATTPSVAPVAPPPVSANKPPAPVVVAPPVKWERQPPPGPLEPLKRFDRGVGITFLPNGLRVVVVEHHRRPIVSVRLVLPTGSASESPAVLGVSFFAISLLGEFYERDDELDPIGSEKTLRRQLIEAGGQFRYGLSPDSAHVGVDGYSVDTGKYLKLLSEAVQNPRHGNASFKARRRALRGEFQDLELNDSAAFGEVVRRAAFGESHPYGWSAVGTDRTLRELGLEEVKDRQAGMLGPRGATLLIVGDVDTRAMFAAARSAFSSWSPEEQVKSAKVARVKVQKKQPVLLVERKPAFTTSVCAARPLGDIQGSDAELSVLAAILGRYRLYETLREQRGLTYTTHAEVVRRKHGRALLACTRLRAADGGEGMKAFVETVQTLAKDGPTQVELDRAKASLISRVEGSGETVAGTVDRWLTSMDLGVPAEVQPEISALNAVTLQAVQRIAKQALKADTLNVVVWGDPAKATPTIIAAGLGKPARVGLKTLVADNELDAE